MGDPITAAIFSAYLKCRTKAYLLAAKVRPSDTYFSDLESQISALYKPTATLKLIDINGSDTPMVHINCESGSYDIGLHTPKLTPQHPLKSTTARTFTPVLFLPWEKTEAADSLSWCFGALAALQTGKSVSNIGILLYGNRHRQRKLKIEDHISGTLKTITEIGSTCLGNEPPLALNRHCAVCDFQSRCRSLAIESDNLSLLSAMTPKDRAKVHAKGILTISQLSYGYRPRRRKRTKPDSERATLSLKSTRTSFVTKHDHKLKALAIKKNQLHVVNSPSVQLKGIPRS